MSLSVLLVEDNEPDATYIEELFRETEVITGGERAESLELIHVETLSQCQQQLDETDVDMVLLDLNLPDSSGLDTLEAVMTVATDEPVVVLTGLDDEATGLEAIERGAQDFLVKSDVNSTLLGRTIQYAIERQRREQQLRGRNEELSLLNRLVGRDIRDEMALVRGWGEPMYDHVDPEGEENLDRLLEATTHVVEFTDTVSDFLDALQDRDSASLRPIDLVSTLGRELEKIQSQYSQATVQWEERPSEPVFVRATELLSSVFRNLLTNAVQHNDAADPTVRVTVSTDNDTVVVSVTDNGPGIDDRRKDAVFGRSASGLADPECGVGLYLVDTLVDMYGGDIRVADNEPRGTVVEVTLQRTTGTESPVSAGDSREGTADDRTL